MKRLIVIGARATGSSLALVRGALARQAAVPEMPRLKYRA